jgi:hypothetical protein
VENIPVLNRKDFLAEWFQTVGWCCGSMTVYPLLKKGGAYREAALNNLDFIVNTGIAENGLACNIYDGEKWIWEENCEGNNAHSWKHIRPQADFIYYLLKALDYERSLNVDHPKWLEAARCGLDTFCDIWGRYGEFGFRIIKDKNPPEMFEGGSCAGAFVLQALTQGMRFFPENDRYRSIYRTACHYYYKKYVVNGHCTGGPLDIFKADDSESAAAMTDAFVQGWHILKDDSLLGMAEDAVAIFASWVVSYVAPFPKSSTLDGYNPCGGVIANVQNRHIGPGICTNSGRFLYDLYKATGKQLYRNVYIDILHAAVNYVARYDGEFSGYNGERGIWFPFKKGAVSEQVNLTDSLNQAGEMWNVACSWPVTAMLLAWAECPHE